MFHYILCDEFQDVSSDQFEFLRQMSSAHHNICVVGDDDQSVISNSMLLNFETFFRYMAGVELS